MQLLWNSWNFAQLNNQSHFTQRDVQHRYYSAQTLVFMKQFEKSIVYNILFVNSRRLVALKCCYLFTVISLDLREEKEYTKFIEKFAKVKENLKILLDISAVQSCWSEKQELCSKRVVLFIEKCIIIQDESSFCVLQRTSWLFANRALVLWRFFDLLFGDEKKQSIKIQVWIRVSFITTSPANKLSTIMLAKLMKLLMPHENCVEFISAQAICILLLFERCIECQQEFFSLFGVFVELFRCFRALDTLYRHYIIT